jgi:hypothetical protein
MTKISILKNFFFEPKWALFIILLLCLVSRLIWYVGIGMNDDMGYIHHARSLANGSNILLNGGSQLAFRLGMVVPLMLLNKLFGYQEWSFSIFPIATSMLTCIFIFRFCYQQFGWKSAVLSSLLWIVFPLQSVYDTQLSPSNQHATCLMGALFFLSSGEHGMKSGEFPRWRYVLYCLMAGAFLGIGWMVNELFVITIIGAIPVLIGFKPSKCFLFYSLIGFGVVFTLDFIISYYASGSVFARISSIYSTEQVVLSNKSLEYLPRILFKVFDSNFLNDEGLFGNLAYVFILCSFLALILKQWKIFSLGLAVYFIIAYLQWGVMSVQGDLITKYVRYLSMIAPFVCIVSGSVFSRFLKKRRCSLLIYLLIVFILLIINVKESAEASKEFRILTSDFKKIAEYFVQNQVDCEIILDDTSRQFVELYSNETLKMKSIENAVNKEFFAKSCYIVLDGSRGFFEQTNKPTLLLEWQQESLNKWLLIKTIKGENKGIFAQFNPRIYKNMTYIKSK